jgi:N-acetylglucosaminyldiphosphoundecaprenol N-acetyl-beta-D-mannosaminyltransferase
MRGQFPGISIAGTFCPPFSPLSEGEDQFVIERINASEADIVWIGLSTPKQERWMAAHLGTLHAPVMIGVGAAFDFLSGRKPQAPRWIQRSGSEWLFRLMTEPGRLWKRYIRYPLFPFLLALQVLRIREFPIEE